jgi:hypothetical protein
MFESYRACRAYVCTNLFVPKEQQHQKKKVPRKPKCLTEPSKKKHKQSSPPTTTVCQTDGPPHILLEATSLQAVQTYQGLAS